MNTRAKGRKFEKEEETFWASKGWETELVRPEARFIGPGKFVTAYRDFFGRYDLIAASPKDGIVCLIQVSTEPPSSHKTPGPLGFMKPAWGKDGLDYMPIDVIVTLPMEKTTWQKTIWQGFSGVYEIYVRYIRDGRSYVAQRTWWERA